MMLVQRDHEEVCRGVATQRALSAALYLLILALLPDTEKIRCRRRAISIIISYTVTVDNAKICVSSGTGVPREVAENARTFNDERAKVWCIEHSGRGGNTQAP